MTELQIAFSPCPNDTFIFHAMLHGLVDTGGIIYSPNIHDIEYLNQQAVSGRFHISKLSFYAYLELMDKYELLDSGAALGYGCGPLIVARKQGIDLTKCRIAVPGKYTTANLLFKLYSPDSTNIIFTRFDNIMGGIKSGEFDAGVIIHEGRFVYKIYDLVKIIDLGEWWESETGMPIPLGCIAIKKNPGIYQYKNKVEATIRDSINFAFNNREASKEYIKLHSQELDDSVINNHIDLYVNEFSLSLGEKGRNAVDKLKEIALKKHIIK